jgi:hypothetical protein
MMDNTNFEETMTACEEAVEGFVVFTEGEWAFHHNDITLPGDSLICERSVFMASLGEFKPSEITEEDALSIMKL